MAASRIGASRMGDAFGAFANVGKSDGGRLSIENDAAPDAFVVTNVLSNGCAPSPAPESSQLSFVENSIRYVVFGASLKVPPTCVRSAAVIVGAAMPRFDWMLSRAMPLSPLSWILFEISWLPTETCPKVESIEMPRPELFAI